MTDWRQHTRIFYGWYLAAAMFVILFFTGGTGFYVFPVFISSLQQEFGWSMTQISGSAGLWALVYGLSSPVVGVLIARAGLRKTMLVAVIIASAVNLGMALLTGLRMLYVLMPVAGFVCAATTLVPGQTMVTNWFNRYRGRAMALALTGIGVGGFFLPPLNEYLIRLWGWRSTFAFGSALLWVIVIPLIVIFVRTKPSELGLRPDGTATDPGTEDAASARTRSGLAVKRAIRTREFALLTGIYLLQLIGMSALNFHFVPFATQQAGFTSQQAAWFLGLAIGLSVVGKLLYGWLADRFNPVILQATTGLLMAVGPASIELLVIRSDSHNPNVLWLYAVGYGLGLGGQVIMLPVLVGRCFGELHFSKIMGLVMSGFAAGILIGIPVAGWTFDRYTSYEPAFLGCILVFLLSAVVPFFIRWERYHAEFVAAE